MKIENFIRPDLLDIIPYSAARDEFVANSEQIIMLDANENNLSQNFNRYPSSNHQELKTAMAAYLGVEEGQVMFGNGSDEIIDLIIRLFATPFKDKMIVCEPTYGMYRVTAKLNGVEVIDIPLTPKFEPDLEEISKQTAKILWICNPNNPTGNVLTTKQVAQLAESFHGIIVIDEAYIDFCKEHSAVSLLDKYPNLIVIQTFSKAKGAAGIRLGYAIANPTIIKWLSAIKPPYNVNVNTYAFALNECKNNQWKQWVTSINSEKDRVISELKKLKVIQQVFPSEANFVLFRVENANELYQALINKGVVIRNRSKQINNTLRVTIGTKKENDTFIKLIQSWQMN